MKMGKSKPYTVQQVKKAKCARCKEPASFQWSVCALNNNSIPICVACDVELNRLTLKFLNDFGGFPTWSKPFKKYLEMRMNILPVDGTEALHSLKFTRTKKRLGGL